MQISPADKVSNTASSMTRYAIFQHPKIIAFSGLAFLVLLGWVYLGIMVSQMIPLMDMAKAGPGMSVFNMFSDWAKLDDFGRAVLNSLCGPGFAAITGANAGALYSIGFLTAMWTAMAIAMMLPTAAPMISAYVQICETASAKSIATVSPLVLIAGYISVWLAFALGAAILQAGFIYLSLLSPAMVTTHHGIAAVLLIGAGVYQFTNLKQACLTKCRTPLNFFFAHWSTHTSNIFRLGVRQGVFCFGCCWALMLVMFVTGIMNVVWMALLSVLMVAEKTVTKADRLRRITGFVLIGWGALSGISLLLN